MTLSPIFTATELAEFRAEARARMLSRVKVWREGSPAGQNEDNGLEGSTWSAVYTDWPFRLRRSSLAGSSNGTKRVTIAGVVYQMSIADGNFPVGTKLKDADIIEIVTGDHPGTYWKVVEASQQDQQSAVRVPVIEVQKPRDLP